MLEMPLSPRLDDRQWQLAKIARANDFLVHKASVKVFRV